MTVQEPKKQRRGISEKVWDWWTSSAYTRLEDHAAVIGMLTDGMGMIGRENITADGSGPKSDQYKFYACNIMEEPVLPEEDLRECRKEQLFKVYG
jgi:hypothetical protein